jgi:hypothetical protein
MSIADADMCVPIFGMFATSTIARRKTNSGDLEDPAAAVHIAADDDDLADEAFPQIVDPREVFGDRRVGERDLDARGRGRLGQGGEAFAAFFDREGQELLDKRVAELKLLGPVGPSCVVVGLLIVRRGHGFLLPGACSSAAASGVQWESRASGVSASISVHATAPTTANAAFSSSAASNEW